MLRLIQEVTIGVCKSEDLWSSPSSSPSLVVPSPGAKLMSGNPLNLSCSTGDQLLPGIQVKWLHPKRSTLRAAGPFADRLVIPKVSTEDSGTWRCELLQNWTRLTSAEITLSIGEHRKWEESRTCVTCSYGKAIMFSAPCRTCSECVDAGDHLQRWSHPDPPPCCGAHPPPQTTGTLGLSIRLDEKTLRLETFNSLSFSCWTSSAEDETPQASSLPVRTVRRNSWTDNNDQTWNLNYNFSLNAFLIHH